MTLGEALRASVPSVFAGEGESATETFAVHIQGVTPPLESPLGDLAAALCHPDHFLYVVLLGT